MERLHLCVMPAKAGIPWLQELGDPRTPHFITAMGALFLLAGVAIPFIGSARIERLANWWLERPDWLLRVWAVAAGSLGGVFVWCGV